MSSPLNSELKQKYNVRRRAQRAAGLRAARRRPLQPAGQTLQHGAAARWEAPTGQQQCRQPHTASAPRSAAARNKAYAAYSSAHHARTHAHARARQKQVKAVPIRKDDEVAVVRGTFKVGRGCGPRALLPAAAAAQPTGGQPPTRPPLRRRRRSS
jgi:hypothetical protein